MNEMLIFCGVFLVSFLLFEIKNPLFAKISTSLERQIKVLEWEACQV